jgi:hypothetical protein
LAKVCETCEARMKSQAVEITKIESFVFRTGS